MAELMEAEARVPLTDPEAALAALADRFAGDAEVVRTAAGAVVASPRFGRLSLATKSGVLVIACACPTASALAYAKMATADALARIPGAAPAFAWTGAGAGGGAPAFFRELAVVRAHPVTPRMRRVVLAGDAAHFDAAALHVRVLIPPPGRAPVWPRADAMGRLVWPQGADALVPRVYTVRAVDRARGEIAIDVALHDGAATPGADWARNARPGARVGLLGPGGAPFVPAAVNLFAGDETALPAIARMLEALPARIGTVRVEARCVIEVADAAEEQPLRSPAALAVRWLHRGGAPAGTTDLIEAGLRGEAFPTDRSKMKVFAGCEQALARRLRTHLLQDRGLHKSQIAVAAYWRRGHEGVDISD
ncbi:siderophore-interacting protein [Xanthobacter sp. KR7-225]|uniref:siderophore-interacting protein n=1 Tax=Xanthobacter sp. KR7-225 TaxID=3156613 RepID=UPI0032B5E624